MAGARSRSRTLLALGACLALAALAGLALLGRPTAPDEQAQTTLAPAADGASALPAVSAAPDAASPRPDASGIPHTKLPLRLLATVVRKNPALSLATIEDAARTTNEVLSEGQSFAGHPKARIAQIERARLLIDNDGVREQLVIANDRAALEAAGDPLTPEQRERRRDHAQRLRALMDAGTDYREELGRGSRGGLLSEGDLSAVYENGEMVGVQLDGLREGGVYERFGLRNGDVVTGINGVSLADSSAAAEVLGQFVTSDELSLSVERGDGSVATLEISTEDLRTAVGELE